METLVSGGSDSSSWEQIEIIAEIGSNHEGDFQQAVRLIEEAARAGATSVKGQVFDPNRVYAYDPSLVQRGRLQPLPIEWIGALSQQARSIGLKFGVSVFDAQDLVFSPESVDFLKLAASQAGNAELQRLVASVVESHGLKLYVSASGRSAVKKLRSVHGGGSAPPKDLTILICSSHYPTSTWESGIALVGEMVNAFPLVRWGYSDHTLSLETGAVMVALGGVAIEKHFRLPDTYYTPDAQVSVTPDEFRVFVQHIHNAVDLLRLPEPYPRRD